MTLNRLVVLLRPGTGALRDNPSPETDFRSTIGGK
jgi:hypothetical protein